MGALMRSIDWAKTPLGTRVAAGRRRCARWSACCCATASRCCCWWGPQFVQLYNDAYRPILGAKHPRSMGQPARRMLGGDLAHHRADDRGAVPRRAGDLQRRSASCCIDRNGFLEETHFKVAYSPVPDETVQPTGIGGVLATVAETTEKVYRRAAAAHAARAGRARRGRADAGAGLREGGRDAGRERPRRPVRPLLSAGRERAHRAPGRVVRRRGRSGDVAPPTIALGRRRSTWPLAEVAARRPRGGGHRSARAIRRAARAAPGGAAAHGDRAAARVARSAARLRRADRRRQPAPRAGRRLPRLLRAGRRADRDRDPQRRARTRRSASAPRRWPSSTAPRRRSSATSATSSARR